MNRAAKAWFWMLDYSYTVADELLALIARPDTASWLNPIEIHRAERDQRPVILLPGIFETASVLRRIGAEAHQLGHPVHVLPNLGRTVASIDAVARQVRQYIDAHRSDHVLLVAHSKGGLIGKYLMLRFDDEQRVDGLIAINAPFAGSQWGRLPSLPSVRALAPDDLTVRFIAASSAVDARIVSVYSRYDQNVRAGSRLSGARNVRLGVAGHSRILGSKALARLLPEAISWIPRRTEPAPRGRESH